MTGKVFLAHRHPDGDAAQALANALRARGVDVWLDRDEILPGDDWVAAMERGLAGSAGGILLLGDHPLPQTWTWTEYATLLARSVEMGRFLIPVRLHPGVAVPELIRTRMPAASDDVDGIVRAVEVHLRRLGGGP